MKLAAASAATAAALAFVALSAASALGKAAAMTVSCHKAPGSTVVTGITDDKSHFKFQWWYANGSTYKDPSWAYYTNAISKGRLSVRTHAKATRVLVTEHRQTGGLVRIHAACR